MTCRKDGSLSASFDSSANTPIALLQCAHQVTWKRTAETTSPSRQPSGKFRSVNISTFTAAGLVPSSSSPSTKTCDLTNGSSDPFLWSEMKVTTSSADGSSPRRQGFRPPRA